MTWIDPLSGRTERVDVFIDLQNEVKPVGPGQLTFCDLVERVFDHMNDARRHNEVGGSSAAYRRVRFLRGAPGQTGGAYEEALLARDSICHSQSCPGTETGSPSWKVSPQRSSASLNAWACALP